MKILLTGITSIQTNSRGPRSKRDYISFPYVLNQMLLDLGHKVTFAPYTPSIHNLNSYDVVLIGLAPTSSRVSIYAYNAFLAMQHERKLFYLVDWNVKAAFSQRIASEPFGDFVAGCNKLDPSRVERKIIEKKIRWFFENKHDVLAQMFNWGDHDDAKEGVPIRKLISIDPTPFMFDGKVVQAKVKTKAWVSATLKDNDEKLNKLNLSWPIIQYNKDNYLSEAKLIDEIYSKNWGVIALPYYHRGCGWFRGRFIHAIKAGSILHAHPNEAGELGTPYVFDVESYESASPKELKFLVNGQRDCFMKHVISKEDTLDKLSDILRRM